jgi:hypothetical protein
MALNQVAKGKNLPVTNTAYLMTCFSKKFSQFCYRRRECDLGWANDDLEQTRRQETSSGDRSPFGRGNAMVNKYNATSQITLSTSDRSKDSSTANKLQATHPFRVLHRSPLLLLFQLLLLLVSSFHLGLFLLCLVFRYHRPHRRFELLVMSARWKGGDASQEIRPA